MHLIKYTIYEVFMDGLNKNLYTRKWYRLLGNGFWYMEIVQKTVKHSNEQLGNVQGLFASTKQMSLLLAFSDGAKSLKELELLTKSRSQNLLPRIGELAEKGILKKCSRGRYKATPAGAIIIFKMLDFLDIYEILGNDFWTLHDISVIPKNLLLNINALSSSQFLQADATLDASQRAASQFFKNAKERIWGISPAVTLEWAKIIIDQANRGIKIYLITTENVLKMASAEEFREYTPLTHPNIELWINNGLKLAYMSNEEFITLALPDKRSNTLDLQNILICQNPKAVEWGRKLFEYFKNISHKIDEI